MISEERETFYSQKTYRLKGRAYDFAEEYEGKVDVFNV